MRKLTITKPIRLIELFAGIGSQAMALRNLGVAYESYVTCEWCVQPNASYKAILCGDDTRNYSEGIEKAAIIEWLHKKGISNDGKKPMTLQQIQRKPEKWLRDTYNNIKATHNLVNIQQATGKELKIVDTDKYEYILTYSFPCQDLSVAGKMAGMDEGSNTRSSMLWEVKRLLEECGELPQILLMENVPQVMQKKNIANFERWKQFLEDKGYKNYAEILNSKDYGVAQNRARAFMVSVLGDFSYAFPNTTPLTKCMADYLEEEVEEKYFVNTEKAECLIADLVKSGKLDKQVSSTICRDNRLISMGFTENGTKKYQGNQVFGKQGLARCLLATDYKHKMRIIDDANGS